MKWIATSTASLISFSMGVTLWALIQTIPLANTQDGTASNSDLSALTPPPAEIELIPPSLPNELISEAPAFELPKNLPTQTSPTDDLVLEELKNILRRDSEPKSLLRTKPERVDEPPSLHKRYDSSVAVRAQPWHAIEKLLQSARLLDREARWAMKQGNIGDAERLAATAKRIRSEVISLIDSTSTEPISR